MNAETTALVGLAAAMSTGREAELLEAMELAATLRDRVAVEEVLLQGYLFIGYPATIRALRLWRELVGGPPAAVAPPETRE